MTDSSKAATVIFAAGAVVGGVVVLNYMARKYNKLVDKHNRLIADDLIRIRVFKEIMPQLPDDYELSEQTIIDIKASLMFADNDM